MAVPAHALIEKLLVFIRPVLEARGEWDEISSLMTEPLQSGNGATQQRQAYQGTGRLEAVVDLILAETAKGIEVPQ